MKIKTKYHWLAAILILGHKSPKIKEFSIYGIIGKAISLEVTEQSSLENSRYNTIRKIRLFDHLLIRTSHLINNVAKILSLEDNTNNINVSDTLFYDADFKIFKNDWGKILDNRIDKLALLLESLYNHKKEDIPIMINEFPNITKIMLNREEIWNKKRI